MDLKEFALDFLQMVLVTVESEGISQEDALTTDILEYLKDTGEVQEPELCPYKVRGIKINAFDYDEENNTLDLFVTIFKGEQHLTKVSENDISDSFKKAVKFFNDAKSKKLLEKIDESDEPTYELTQLITHEGNNIENVRIFLLTNGIAPADATPPSVQDGNCFITYHLWDIERIHQQYLVIAGKHKIEIDFLNDYSYKMKCLKIDGYSDKVDSYLSVIPGKLLSDIYKKFRQGLLEQNVRTFLQFKAKVNQGIRNTIKEEPDMFLAYNNGISTTAEKIDFMYEETIPYITKIENWQIVNGGQTTASISAASLEKNVDLSKVYVPMKISVIKNSENVENIVPKISRFANSQTAIRESDFSSNSPYHISLENFSRTEWIPVNTGGKPTNKWFYERTRGQYLDEQSKRNTPSELKKFKIEYPKNKKFTKTDLAKYEMSWLQRPYDVSKGAEKNFNLFKKEIDYIKKDVSLIYYKRLIAKAILFKEIDSIVYRKALGGYKANMVSYLMSLISHLTSKRLDLDRIWENQTISDETKSEVDSLIDLVWDHINNPFKPGMNIGEWCKKAECWMSLKDKVTGKEILKNEMKEKSDGYDEIDIVGQDLTPQEIRIIEDACLIRPEVYFAISKWAKENSKFSPFDRKFAYNMGALLNRKVKLSIKQSKNALRIYRAAIDEGFEE